MPHFGTTEPLCKAVNLWSTSVVVLASIMAQNLDREADLRMKSFGALFNWLCGDLDQTGFLLHVSKTHMVA